jgi:hypothetical protein
MARAAALKNVSDREFPGQAGFGVLSVANQNFKKIWDERAGRENGLIKVGIENLHGVIGSWQDVMNDFKDPRKQRARDWKRFIEGLLRERYAQTITAFQVIFKTQEHELDRMISDFKAKENSLFSDPNERAIYRHYREKLESLYRENQHYQNTVLRSAAKRASDPDADISHEDMEEMINVSTSKLQSLKARASSFISNAKARAANAKAYANRKAGDFGGKIKNMFAFNSSSSAANYNATDADPELDTEEPEPLI